MTTTYDKIHSESQYWLAVQKCNFVIEFKDERGAPPPFNLFWPLMAFVQWLAPIRVRRAKSCSSRGFGVPVGLGATNRVQARERFFARRFDIQRERNDALRTDSRIADIHQGLPTVFNLGRRCTAIEDASRALAEQLERRCASLERANRDIANALRDQNRLLRRVLKSENKGPHTDAEPMRPGPQPHDYCDLSQSVPFAMSNALPSAHPIAVRPESTQPVSNTVESQSGALRRSAHPIDVRPGSTQPVSNTVESQSGALGRSAPDTGSSPTTKKAPPAISATSSTSVTRHRSSSVGSSCGSPTQTRPVRHRSNGRQLPDANGISFTDPRCRPHVDFSWMRRLDVSPNSEV